MDEYREIVNVGPVHLSRSDLHELERVLRKDLSPRPDSLRIEVRDGARTVTANSMEQLFQSRLPNRTSKLSVGIKSWNDQNEIDGGVYLRLHRNFVDYQIYANSETLFLGKKTQLDAFLRAHRPWYTLITRFLPMVGPSVSISALFSAALLARQGSVVSAILSGTLAVVTAVAVWLSITQKLFPYVRVQLSESPIRRSAFEQITLLVQVLLLVATIISILFPLFVKSPR